MRRGGKEGGGSSSQGQASGSGSGAPQSAADFADEMRITMFRLGVDNRPMSERCRQANRAPYSCHRLSSCLRFQNATYTSVRSPLIQGAITLAEMMDDLIGRSKCLPPKPVCLRE